jgi:hypothetical protein
MDSASPLSKQKMHRRSVMISSCRSRCSTCHPERRRLLTANVIRPVWMHQAEQRRQPAAVFAGYLLGCLAIGPRARWVRRSFVLFLSLGLSTTSRDVGAPGRKKPPRGGPTFLGHRGRVSNSTHRFLTGRWDRRDKARRGWAIVKAYRPRRDSSRLRQPSWRRLSCVSLSHGILLSEPPSRQKTA